MRFSIRHINRNVLYNFLIKYKTQCYVLCEQGITIKIFLFITLFFIQTYASGMHADYWSLWRCYVSDSCYTQDHIFQTKYRYGIYTDDGSQLEYFKDIKALSIAYDYDFSSHEPFPNYKYVLDNNNTVHVFLNSFQELNHKFHVKELQDIDELFRNHGSLFLISSTQKKSLAYEENHAYDGIKKNRFVLGDKYDIHSYSTLKEITYYYWDGNTKSTKLIDTPATLDYCRHKNYVSSEIFETEYLDKISFFHRPTILLDKKKDKLYIYEDNKIVNQVDLPSTPHFATYDWKKDLIYVIYENKKGIFTLKNHIDKSYFHVQEIVRDYIDGNYFEYLITFNLGLERYLNYYRDFHYKVTIENNKAEVLVFGDATREPFKRAVLFVLTKDGNDWEIIDIKIKD